MFGDYCRSFGPALCHLDEAEVEGAVEGRVYRIYWAFGFYNPLRIVHPHFSAKLVGIAVLSDHCRVV